MPSPPSSPIGIAAAQRRAAAWRVAVGVCRSWGSGADSDASRVGDGRRRCLRVVCTVTDEATLQTRVDRAGAVPLHHLHVLVADYLRQCSGHTRDPAAAAVVPCWLTLLLRDGCVLQHAFFGAAPSAAEPLRFFAVESPLQGERGEAAATAVKETAPAPSRGVHREPSPPLQQQVHSTPPAQLRDPAGAAGVAPPQPPTPSPAPAAPTTPPRRAWTSTPARLCELGGSCQQQPHDSARRGIGSPFREELWRLAERQITTNHALREMPDGQVLSRSGSQCW